ncbi:hypothetical protein MMAD_31510 [Mycolicibacterium madagascariense]|uniref:Uncharacterized protein n=1 Tax=Mycolicibacterium madagascariense TaxID=212765 RepID=A0A7I7XI21_9MYCO|nr:hypothetical protein MMAD_31510 [Mycolicibacterium madagascariense]
MPAVPAVFVVDGVLVEVPVDALVADDGDAELVTLPADPAPEDPAPGPVSPWVAEVEVEDVLPSECSVSAWASPALHMTAAPRPMVMAPVLSQADTGITRPACRSVPALLCRVLLRCFPAIGCSPRVFDVALRETWLASLCTVVGPPRPVTRNRRSWREGWWSRRAQRRGRALLDDDAEANVADESAATMPVLDVRADCSSPTAKCSSPAPAPLDHCSSARARPTVRYDLVDDHGPRPQGRGRWTTWPP